MRKGQQGERNSLPISSPKERKTVCGGKEFNENNRAVPLPLQLQPDISLSSHSMLYNVMLYYTKHIVFNPLSI